MALFRRKNREHLGGGRRGRPAPTRSGMDDEASDVGSGRVQPALEERWEEAWRRARAADLR